MRSMSDEDGGEGAPLWVWFGLAFVATVSFWCQSAVTEERFVPALNVIANHFNIPDDVAGATLMAAGASSPELFSSIVALFITHSALGLGTIVGSEIFNQLVICAGAILAARSGKLHLDRAILSREVGFYALSIILLMFALKDRRRAPDDDEFGPEHIYISFNEAALLFGGYILYVLVCSYFESIVSWFSKGAQLTVAKSEMVYGSVESSSRQKHTKIKVPEDMPFLKQVKYEPKGNFHSPASRRELIADGEGGDKALLYQTKTGGRSTKFENLPSISSRSSGSAATGSAAQAQRHPSILAQSVRTVLSKFSDGASLRLFEYMVDAEKPSDQHELHDLEINAFEERLSCFLWQRSIFYNKAKVALNGWQLRWFTFTHDKVVSVPNRVQCEKHKLIYPKFEEIEVDESRQILNLKKAGKRDYVLMAPSEKVFKAVVDKCEEILQNWDEEKLRGGTGGLVSAPAEIDVEDSVDANAEASLIDFPRGESSIAVLIFLVLFPLRFLLHFTVPDVRGLTPKGDPSAPVMTSFLAILSCLVWLVIGSYAMVASLEALADLMNIPDAVIGVTVSAAGTSLPNYVASQCAARQGLGNMAVSNAFGSNTFNILVGLGLPWTLYTAFATNGEPYHGLRDDGISMSVVILGTVLLIFVVLVMVSNFVLYRWHAALFFALYAAYLAYAIGQVFIG